MAEYDIGEGKKIKIPDNLDPEIRLQLAEVVKDKYGIDINQTSALGQVGEFVKAIPRGAAGLALDVPTGIVGLFDIGNDSNLYKGLEGLQDRLREDSILAGDPAYADKFSTKLGEGIGSFGPFLGAGMVGRALAKAPGAAKGILSPTFTAPTALAIPTGIAAQGDRLQMARDMGEDVSGLTETTAELFGGLIGITEVLPIANILGKVHKNAPLSAKEKLVSALQSGAAEGGQEVAASILQDLTARGLYSEDLPIADSMFEEFTIGGIIGGAADLVVSSMAGKKSVRNKQLEEDNLRADETKAQLINAKKADLAMEQGTLEEIQDIPPTIVPQLIAPEELTTEPSVEVVMTPQEQFAVVDITNPEAPAQVDIKDTEIEAIKVRDKITKDFNNKKLKSKLDNDTYNLGLINSSTAYEIGQSLEDSRASDVTIQQLINSVPKDSKQEVILRGLVNSFVAQNPGKTSRSYPRLSMTKAKELLTPKQFNEFTSAYAQGVFKASEKNGEPSIVADKDKPNTSAKYIKEIAESKNIDLNFQSPAVQYAAEKYTGTPEFKNMKQGQKELFLAKLHSLPKFNSRTTFPDFRPRDYSAQDMAEFVANIKSNNMTFNKASLKQMGQNEQFLDDLIYSNRAEKIEGTNNYKIRDNFEFDIARRAEGFNETPEEFGARLTAEGKLPPESIAELIQQETVKQERLLPPAEVIPKTINYAETLEQGKTNKFAQEVRKILNARGLKDTGIVISDDIISTTTLRQIEGEIKYDPSQLIDPKTGKRARGEYDKNTDTIFLSLNAVNPDGSATDVEIQERLNKVLDHEMIHALRAKDLITEAEYQYLKKQVEQQKDPNTNKTFFEQAKLDYSDISARARTDTEATEFLYEEAIAELFRKKDLLVNNPPKVEGIYNKIIEFFKSMGQAMRSSGYKSATEIFNDIESGRIGRRERGVVRTTRIGDKGLQSFNFATDFSQLDEPAVRPTPIPGDEIRQTLKPTGIRPLTIPKPTPTTTTPPAGPTTPPVAPTTSPVPNKIYNAREMSFVEKAEERQFILDGLKKAGVFNPRSRAKGDSVKMIKWLKDNAPNKDYKIIATKVHQSLIALKKLGYDFPLEITSAKNKTRGFRGRVSYTVLPRPTYFEMRINDAFGKDIPQAVAEIKATPPLEAVNFVAEYINNSNGVNFETLLHEGIHQATIAQMENVSGGAKSNNKKIQKAYKDLASQRKRVETHVRDMMSKFNEGATSIDEGNLTFDEFISSLPTTLNPALRRDLVNVYFSNGNLRTKNEVSNGLRNFEKNFIQYKINGIQSGNRKADSSEFLTFGLTNRNFQELLESIPTKPGATKTIWNEFVETIRNILGLPAKLDTELSAFLKNAGVALDLQAEGVPLAGMDVGGRGVAEEVSLFSRESDDAYFANEKRKRTISNLEAGIEFKEAQLNSEKMAVSTANRLKKEIQNQKNKIAELRAGDLPTFSRTEEPIGKFTIKKDEYIEGNINAGKILGYDVEIYRDTGGLGGENYSMIITDPRVDMDTDSKSIGLYSKNLQEAKEDAVDKIQGLINDGDIVDPTSVYFTRGIGPRETLAKLKDTDLPTFSRAATETQPPYMDFNRQQIRDFSSNRVGFYNGVEIPLTHVTRMNVDDFLKLTTFDQEHINDIMEEGPTVLNRQFTTDAGVRVKSPLRKASAIFDPEIADTALNASLPSLQIKNDGQVISHEGRHRVALIKQGGGRTVPVFIHFPEGNPEQNISNPSGQTLQEQGVTSLKNENKFNIGIEYTEEFFNFELPINKLKEIAPLHRDSAQTKDKLDYAVQVATTPDILESTKDTVASASEYDIRMARFLASQNIPTFSRATSTPIATDIENKPSVGRLKNKFILDKNGTLYEGKVERKIQYDENDNILEDEDGNLILKNELVKNDISPDVGVFGPERNQGILTSIKGGYFIDSIGRENKDYPSIIGTLKDGWTFQIVSMESIGGSKNEFGFLLNKPDETGWNTDYKVADVYEYYNKEIPYTYKNMGYFPPVDRYKDALPYIGYFTKPIQESVFDTDLPTFSRGRRDDTGTNIQENIQLREALAEAEETVKQTPRGSIPYYNLNASDTALKIAIDFNKDLSAKAPDDIPNFSRPTLDGLQDNLQEFIKRTGGEILPDQSWGARVIEIVKDPITSIKNFFKEFRQRYIDQYDTLTKTLLAGKTKEFYIGRINPKTKKEFTEEEAIAAAEQVTLVNMFASAGAEQSVRMSDKSRGVYQGMLTRGIPTDVIDGVASLVKTIPLELVDANGNLTGKTGGLIQILAPLFSNPNLNLEAAFKSYAMLKRAKNLDESGREIDTPVKPKDYVLIQQIEQQHPEILEVYNNYQNWNNALIKLAESKGILSAEQSALWREHSVYYPFYRQMVDDSGIKGPKIAGGSLPGNPLDIQIKGSEEIIDADPIEAISRNSLSILTAALKNDAMNKIVRDLETMGLAQKISAKDAGKADSLFFFENGNKQHYQVDDPRLVYSLQNVGGVAPGAIGKFLAVPAGLLRDTVTRDPGFVVINILRDTLSSAVTSGAPYTPIIDSVKNMFGSMEELEQFGVLGGYDYSVDEGSVKQFITRTMRQQGLTPNNGMSPTGAFFKLWDGLGALTTKSDGATRKAVYDGVYKMLKEQGLSEAVAQSEAAYQAQEIINFGRRGSDSLFRIITAAIPFLNARIQGLDVLHRGLTGQYSAVEKQQIGESLKDVQSRIFRRTFFNAGLLVGLTALYYMMVSDTDEYKNLKREVRDDNWVMPIGNGNAVKIPIPFEVGMLFKAIPERVFDMTMGDDAFTRKSVDEAMTSIGRQAQTSFNIPFFQPGGGIQLLKPISEVINNRNTFTDTEIVPYYQQKKEPGLQSRPTTNEFARVMGEALNLSPAKIEHVMRGYTGTLGGYVLSVVDTITRGATGSPLIPSNYQLSKMPVFNRLLLDLDKSGGYQQQFYELRGEVDRAVATINSLQKQRRFDELSAYRSNMQGVLNVKGQVRSIERYLDNWRKRRDRIYQDENLSITVKSDLIRDLELERDMRLAMVPQLRKKANIPIFSLNL